MNILWLKTGPLHPPDTGGKLRTFNMVKELRKRHHVTFLALCPDGTDEAHKRAASEYSHKQIWIPWRETRKRSAKFYGELAANQFCSRLPFAVAKYKSAAWTEAIRREDATGRHDVIVCDFLAPAVNLHAAGFKPQTRTLIFQHNVESLIWKRTFDTAKGAAQRFYFHGQWRRMEAFERAACAAVDGVVTVSDEDSRILREEMGLKNVLGAVPTGVDVDFFQPPTGVRTPCSLVFLGSMDWMPNIDGICWFADEVWPLVKKNSPDATLTIVGRKPTDKVRQLAARDSSIIVTGTVDDVRPHLARAQAMVVPLRVGGGTRIKIFEAMATGIPVISTRIGAEGLPVKHGETILLADEPADFAEQTASLFRQPEHGIRLGQAALELVRRDYSWSSVNAVFEGYLRSAQQT
ncbi:MAG: glycosyltransferase [Verrucomicrobia bacterium]|nr:glycosyltransferase [Verrucomicrobiota bacterium]